MDGPVPLTSDSHSPVAVHLRDYLRVIRKRKWAALGVFVSVVAGTALSVLMHPLIYESTISILVEPSGPNVLSKAVEEVYVPIDVNLEYYNTQIEILQSQRILRDVFLRLHLQTHPEYSPKPPGMLKSWLAEMKTFARSFLASVVGGPPEQEDKLPESEVERRLVNAFKQHVTVKLVPNTRIIRVTVESTDPQLAADAANTLASVYITRSLEIKAGASEEAAKWFAVRVEELRRKVEQSERTLQEFASRHGLVNVDARRRLGTQKLGELNAQLVKAEGRRAEAEARFKGIASVFGAPSKLESSAEVLGSPLIQNLRSQEVQAAQKVAEFSERYGPKHPTMVQAASEMGEVQVRIKAEIRKIYASVRAEYEVAKTREGVIRNALNRQKANVIASGQHEVQFGILERQGESDRQIYDMFLKRLRETDIGTDIRTSNIYVADPAIVSLIPIKPRKKLSLFLATLVGLLGGIGLAFFLEYMDMTLKSPDDLARHLPGLPFLGFLPVFNEVRKTPGGVELAVHHAPASPYAEQMRSIRTNLTLSAADKPPTSILVTSSMQDEGKSVFAIGLATAVAQLGRHTVLIEADLRKPSLRQVFDLKTKAGLSHYLVGEAQLNQVMQPTMVPNLKVIPCGAVPPNPAELLQSDTMSQLLETFQKDEVYVVVDGPPILSVADPVILAHRTDGVVLIVQAGSTRIQVVHAAAKRVQDAKTKVLGIVLQRVKKRELASYYGDYDLYYHHAKRYQGQQPEKALSRRV